jgi:hypothetical protein
MAGESSRQASEDEVESLVDDLIREILNESGGSAESSMPGGMATTAALFETAFGSKRRASETSMIERLLLAQAFAAELADALAPALAEQLAPRLLKGLEMHMAADSTSKKPQSGARSSSQARKQDARRP